MTRDEALAELRKFKAWGDGDAEAAHFNADQVLLELLDDDDIRAAFDAIKKWYA